VKVARHGKVRQSLMDEPLIFDVFQAFHAWLP
jgi:hypothetical protein